MAASEQSHSCSPSQEDAVSQYTRSSEPQNWHDGQPWNGQSRTLTGSSAETLRARLLAVATGPTTVDVPAILSHPLDEVLATFPGFRHNFDTIEPIAQRRLRKAWGPRNTEKLRTVLEKCAAQGNFATSPHAASGPLTAAAYSGLPPPYPDPESARDARVAQLEQRLQVLQGRLVEAERQRHAAAGAGHAVCPDCGQIAGIAGSTNFCPNTGRPHPQVGRTPMPRSASPTPLGPDALLPASNYALPEYMLSAGPTPTSTVPSVVGVGRLVRDDGTVVAPTVSEEVTLTKKASDRMGTTWGEESMTLAEVEPGSAAEQQGVRRFIGCRLTHLNGHPVVSTDDIRRLAAGASLLRLRFAVPVDPSRVPLFTPYAAKTAAQLAGDFSSSEGGEMATPPRVPGDAVRHVRTSDGRSAAAASDTSARQMQRPVPESPVPSAAMHEVDAMLPGVPRETTVYNDDGADPQLTLRDVKGVPLAAQQPASPDASQPDSRNPLVPPARASNREPSSIGDFSPCSAPPSVTPLPSHTPLQLESAETSGELRHCTLKDDELRQVSRTLSTTPFRKSGIHEITDAIRKQILHWAEYPAKEPLPQHVSNWLGHEGDNCSLTLLGGAAKATGQAGCDVLRGVRVSGSDEIILYNGNERSCFFLEPDNWLRLRCYDLVCHEKFQRAIIYIILVNALILALDTPGLGSPALSEVDPKNPVLAPSEATPPVLPEMEMTFAAAEYVFQSIYTVECLLKIFATGFVLHDHSYLRNPSSVLDLTVVLVGFSTFIGVRGGNGVALLRVMRPVRVVARIGGMKIIVLSLAESLSGLKDVGLLLGFLMVLFAIGGVELFAGVVHQRCYYYEHAGAVFDPVLNTTLVNATTVLRLVANDTTPCSKTTSGHQCVDNGFTPSQMGDTTLPFNGSQVCEVHLDHFKQFPINFDNAALAAVSVFRVISLDDWPWLVHQVQSATSWWSCLYFLLIVLTCTFITINLFLAVLSARYADVKKRVQEERQRAKKRTVKQAWAGMSRAVRTQEIAIQRSSEDGSFGMEFDDDLEVVAVQGVAAMQAGLRVGMRILRVNGDQISTADELQSLLTLTGAEPVVLSVGAAVRRMSRMLGSVDEGEEPSFLSKVLDAMLYGLLKVLPGHPLIRDIFDESKHPGKMIAHTVMVVTVFNIIVMSSEHHDAPDAAVTFTTTANLVCTCVFFAEAVIKLFGLGLAEYLLVTNNDGDATDTSEWTLNGFNMFDFSLAMLSLPELVQGGGSPLSALRIFRLLRLLRVIRSLLSDSFNNLVASIVASVSAVIYILLCMLLFLFIFGVMGIYLFSDVPAFRFPDQRHNFNTLWEAMLTVFIGITGDSWSYTMATALTGKTWSPYLYFFSMFICGQYCILNFFVAVIVENFALEGEPVEEPEEQASPRSLASPSSQVDREDSMAQPSANRPDVTDLDCDKLSDVSDDRPMAPDEIADMHGINGVVLCNTLPRTHRVRTTLARLFSHQHFKMGRLVVIAAFDVVMLSFERPDRVEDSRTQQMLDAANYVVAFLLSTEICLRLLLGGLGPPKWWIWNHTRFVAGDAVTVRKPPVETGGDAWVASGVVVTVDDMGNVLTLRFNPGQIPGCTCAKAGLCELCGTPVPGENGDPWQDVEHSRKNGLLHLFPNQVDLLVLFAGCFAGMANRRMRCVRSLRIVHLLIATESQRILLLSLIEAVRGLLEVLLICALILLIFSVLAVQLWKGTFYYCTDPAAETKSDCNSSVLWNETVMTALGETTRAVPREWKRLPYTFDNTIRALSTLFQVATADGWSSVMISAIDARGVGLNPRRKANPQNSVFFVLFMVVGGFFAVNLFIGVLSSSFQMEKQKKLQERLEAAKLTQAQINWLKLVGELGQIRLQPHPTDPLQMHVAPQNLTRVQRAVVQLRSRCQRLVLSKPFDVCITVTILLNVSVMAVKHFQQPDWLTRFMLYSHYCFVGIYTVELALKVIGLSWRCYWADTWNRFDCSLVVFGLMSVVVPQLPLLGLLRVLRIGRLAAQSKGLARLVSTMVHAAPSILNVIVLIVAVFYVFAVAGVQLFGKIAVADPNDGLLETTNFKTTRHAFLTLFQVSTLVRWRNIKEGAAITEADGCSQEDDNCGSRFSVTYFVVFVAVGSFTLINLFTTVVLEQFSETPGEDTAAKITQLTAAAELWTRFDVTATGHLEARRFLVYLRFLMLREDSWRATFAHLGASALLGYKHIESCDWDCGNTCNPTWQVKKSKHRAWWRKAEAMFKDHTRAEPIQELTNEQRVRLELRSLRSLPDVLRYLSVPVRSAKGTVKVRYKDVLLSLSRVCVGVDPAGAVLMQQFLPLRVVGPNSAQFTIHDWWAANKFSKLAMRRRKLASPRRHSRFLTGVLSAVNSFRRISRRGSKGSKGSMSPRSSVGQLSPTRSNFNAVPRTE
eukprot:TRINITY_DN26463_c0_g1_i1.p1 TRINITY_DN26463_c0_g1~~TRINITY_DN26463_c0_g1_i1.p1  ORF type:complete len:2411 (+),score=697.09 TRINITY_DN26463_c0_g1_i1:138-7370(+)